MNALLAKLILHTYNILHNLVLLVWNIEVLCLASIIMALAETQAIAAIVYKCLLCSTFVKYETSWFKSVKRLC